MKPILLSVLCALAATAAFGQNVLQNKKADKLYTKLEDAYFNYDYATILDNEPAINELFIPYEDTVTARVYTMLGESYEYQYGDLEKALDFYTKELTLRKKLVPETVTGDLIFNVSSLMVELGRQSEAEGLYLELIESDRKRFGEKDERYWNSELYLLNYYSFASQPVKGLEATKRLKKTFSKKSDAEALRLKAEGDFYEMLGEYSRAEKSLTQGIKLMGEIGLYETIENVGILNSLATLYINQGKLPEAEQLYTEALNITNRIGGDNELFAGGIRSNLAQLNYELGNYEEAEKIYVELLAQDLELYGEESANYGITAYNLGLNQLYAGNYADARKYHELARQVFDVAIDPNDMLNALWYNNMALLSTRTGDPDKALEYGEQAIQSHEQILGADHIETANPNFNLGNAHMALDELDKATQYHQRALDIRLKRAGKNHPLYARSTNQMAILEWKKGNMEAALQYFEETFANYYQQINAYFPILSEEEKTKFYYNKMKPTVEQFNAFVVKAAPNDRRLQGKMYDYQLTLKGLILSSTTKVKNSILSSGDSLLIGKYETWLGQKEQLAQLFSDTELSEAVRNKRIDSLNVASDNLEKELSKLSAAFASTIDTKQPTWQEVKAQLKPGEASIEMVRFRDFATDSAGVFTDEVFYAALVLRHDTEDFPEMILFRNGVEMESRFLANYRNAIKYKINENRSYNLYWRPIANKLQGIKKIYFSPDGVYNQISIYTLQGEQGFLLDEINIQLLNNTRDLIASNAGTTGAAGESVFFGYPNYNMGAVEEEQKAGGATQTAGGGDRGGRGASKGQMDLDQMSIPRGLRGNMLRYMRSDNLLALLPGTKKEVELIDSLYNQRKLENRVFMENQALEDNIKQLRNPRALHIATHGFFLEDTGENIGKTDGYVENPLLRSGLILAGANSFISKGEIGENYDVSDDGILTAYEAMNLPLDNTEIVVLSACETGLGEVKNGEGVFGLQRAFQVAGAKAIIMSMWTVDDAATQELMTNFYEEWLKTGDKHLAFNTAQKRLKDKWKHPYFWGAFVMVGR